MSKEISKSFDFSDTIDCPLDVTFPVFRNEMTRLVEYLPNINRIVELKREKTKDGVALTLQWFARAKLPAMAARLIPENKMMWIDNANWNDKEHCVEYVLAYPDLSDAITVRGKNRFIATGDKTILNLTGEIVADIDKIKGAPNALLKIIVPSVEAFALKMTKPNLIAINRGVEKYVREKSRKP